MIDRKQLLDDARRLTTLLVDDLRDRSDEVDEVRSVLRGEYARAESAGRTERAYEDWREDLLAQVAVGWVLGSVFVRFCEDNQLVDTPLLSGPGARRDIARDHRASWLGDNPALGDREWLADVFDRYAAIDATAQLFGERNPLRLFGPSADGARALLELWWGVDDDGQLVHDFTDAQLDTRFLGDLYQDLSEHAKKTYALLQTPVFVEEFILDRTLDPAIETFGLDETRMIDPTCGSGHFLLGGFERLLERWRQQEPATPVRVLAQNALDAVAGVDINPFAVSIARFRLLVAALQASGIGRLEDAPAFTINVAVGDSLLHGTYAQTTLFSDGNDPLDRHRYPNEDGELASQLLQRDRYTCVAGNPPYITVKDPALSTAYRERYQTCHRQYSLAVPFTELFFALARRGGRDGEAGYVGMITANSFMKREFGKKLIEEYLASEVELTHIIDTSGAYIPGHGTPTVILLGRNERPVPSKPVTALVGTRKEPGVPLEPHRGLVWTAILEQADAADEYESEFVATRRVSRSELASHPMVLLGVTARALYDRLQSLDRTVADLTASAGRVVGLGEDEVWLRPFGGPDVGLPTKPFVVGEGVRDWQVCSLERVVFPYVVTAHGPQPLHAQHSAVARHLWLHRSLLSARRLFGRSITDRGQPWWTYLEFYTDRVDEGPILLISTVATHLHVAVTEASQVLTKETVISVRLQDGQLVDAVSGVLASSVAAFFLRQVCFPKGGSGLGRGVQDEDWEERLAYGVGTTQSVPLPQELPLVRSSLLARLGDEVGLKPVHAELSERPTDLERIRAQREEGLFRMVAMQEELDWECYRLYGLIDGDLTLPAEQLPELEKGQRAFEIVLARKVAAGEVETSWFARHNSTPITELPEHWPDEYRHVVERRIELINSDRTLGLLERPEYKRRWNWDEFDTLAQQVLRSWLLDRLEAQELWADPEVTSTARLADRLRGDEEFREVARLYAGSVDADIADVVDGLVRDEAVPYLAAHRLKPSGLRKRRVWEQVWNLQRTEDAIDARAELSAEDPDHLDAEGVALTKKEQVGKIPVPPRYSSADFRKSVYWRLRGKLDVPKERFVLLPDTRVGSDGTTVIGWAGWDHLEQARALAGHYTSRKEDGAEAEELTPLLAGLDGLVPWLKQWHNDVDPVYGERMGDFFDSFVDSEGRTFGLTRQDLRAWAPPAPTPGRTKAAQ